MKALATLVLLVICSVRSAVAGGIGDPPANDDFDSAQVLPGTRTVVADGSIIDATKEPGDPGKDFSVWYQWTAPVSGRVRLSATSDDYKEAQVLYGDDLLAAEIIASGFITGSGVVRFYAISGVTYRICVSGGRFDQTTFSLGLSCDTSLQRAKPRFVEPNVNDDFDAALTIRGDASIVQYMRSASLEPFEREMLTKVRAPYSTLFGGGGTWVRWIAPATGRAYFSARTIAGEQVVLLAGSGTDIPNLKIRAATFDSTSFACRKGAAYMLYLLSQRDSQVIGKIQAVGR